MLITVDTKIGKIGGAHDICGGLRKRGLHVIEEAMEYGDVAWKGVGPDSRPVLVGVEIKTIPDLLSSILTGRFAGRQLPGLQDAFEVAYLMVVGIWKPGPEGELLVSQYGGWQQAQHGGKGGWQYNTLEQWLTTMEMKGGIHLRRVGSVQEGVAMVHALASWWALGCDHHKSHLEFNRTFQEKLSFVAPSPVRILYSTLPKIGWEKSLAVERRFPKVRDAVLAGDKEWLDIPGIGKTILQKVREVLG